MTSNQESEFTISPEEEARIAEIWLVFAKCEHDWVDQPETSLFYKLCSKCGGAEGIRPEEGFWAN